MPLKEVKISVVEQNSFLCELPVPQAGLFINRRKITTIPKSQPYTPYNILNYRTGMTILEHTWQHIYINFVKMKKKLNILIYPHLPPGMFPNL